MAGSWSERWQRIKAELTLKDLLLDIFGKILFGIGLGALWADAVRPYVWCFIGTGVIISAIVKLKYWNRFWSERYD